jgi:hypothetical protein
MRIQAALIVVIAQGLAGCERSYSPLFSPPTAPSFSLPATPTEVTLVTFRDAASAFETSDLHDSEDEVIQLSTAGELVFPATNTRLPGFRPFRSLEEGILGIVTICSQGCAFVVRFGIKDGERRAYLTVDYGHENPGTLVDVEVANAALVVTQTDLYPPGSPTLTGVVTEVTSTGLMPVEGVLVYRGVTTGYRVATTDTQGFYRIPGLFESVDVVSTDKEGYESSKSSVSITGDTRFDIQIVRR